MNVKKIFLFGAVTAITALTPALRAADAEVKAKVDLPDKTETRTELKRDHDVTVRTDANDTTARSHEKVHASNKASGLIGMEVRNNEGQKLGEIKDLVLDVNSGKVSYAVLAVGGFLGLGEKLIALPPSALNVSDDNSFLKLDADKSRIQAAPGFAATAWPGLHETDINGFWKGSATGGAAGSEVRRSNGKRDVDVDVDHDRNKVKAEIDVDRNDKKIYTDADGDKKLEIKAKKD